MDGWTDGRMDGWTRVHARSSRDSGEPAFLCSTHPHSGERGSQGKEVGQGCPRNTEPAPGMEPPGRWTPTTTPALPSEPPGGGLEGPTQNVGHRWDTGSTEGKGLPSPPQGGRAVPCLGVGFVPVVRAAGPEPAAALLPDGRAGAGRG